MAVTHISLTELSPEVRALIDSLHAGQEIVIDAVGGPVATLRASERPKAKTVAELISRFKNRESGLGHAMVMDDDYANDMREIVANRKPRETSVWD